LIHASTGTGKTLAAWIGPLLEWFADRGKHDARSVGARRDREPRAGAPALRALWLTPLRALAADTREALVDVQSVLAPAWTVETRTGDTSATMRARQAKRLPTALVTTPESLSLMLIRLTPPSCSRSCGSWLSTSGCAPTGT
jgi:ATP-dependent Lhr-like helicase